MNKDVVKHLEFIQNVITRMGTNSFLIKNWAMVIITIVATIIVGLGRDINNSYIFLFPVVLLPFWFLDAFFLSLERRYRDLFEEIRVSKQTGFSMELNKDVKRDSKMWSSFFSKTLFFFYISLAVIVLVIFSIGKYHG